VMAHTEAVVKSKRKAEMLADFRNLRNEQTTKIIPLWRKYVAYAAAASVVLIIGVFALINIGPDESDVYAMYYNPYDGVISTRDDSTRSFEGVTAYNQGRYQKALDLLLTAKQVKGISKGQQLLLIANCYLALDQPDKSIEYLDQVEQTESTLVKDNKVWYEAMSYLKTGDLRKSRELLEQLKDSNSAYASKAEKVLNEDIFK